MSKSWFDTFAIVLAGLVVAIACLDFLLGKAGRRKLQARLETFWLKLSYVKLPTLGLNEAQSFVLFLDVGFGQRLFSWHRFLSTALYVSTVICAAYITFESVRVASGQEFRWPFTEIHWNTGFPAQVLPGMISISVTRLMVNGCIRVVGQSRWSTLVFLLAIGVAAYVSILFSFVIGIALEPIAEAIVTLALTVLHYITHLDEVRSPDEQYPFTFYLPYWWGEIKLGFIVAYHAVKSPLAVWVAFFKTLGQTTV